MVVIQQNKKCCKLKIGNRIVGEKHEPLIIAEIGINHNGSLDEAISIGICN